MSESEIVIKAGQALASLGEAISQASKQLCKHQWRTEYLPSFDDERIKVSTCLKCGVKETK